ncbi:MAG: hypothetical protein QOJ19_999, partial [Acidimicrobiia bacterium]|nr:hypothetical protein [Acidimicrobiia bacterium]
FQGSWFSVKGPSIVPRPPQGQPLVVALAHSTVPFEFAARSADVVLVTPADRDDVARWVADVRTAEQTVGRMGEPLRLFGDLVVVLGDSEAEAQRRLNQLDALDGRSYRSDAAVFTGTPVALADELVTWAEQGLTGFRLRPAVITRDLDAIVDGVVPALQDGGVFRRTYEPGLLRDRLGLDRPVSRYAGTSV